MVMRDFSFVPFKYALEEVRPDEEQMIVNVTMAAVTANLTASPVFGPEGRPLTGATLTLECEDPPSVHAATEQAGGNYVFENAVPTHESGLCTVTIEKKGYVCMEGCCRYSVRHDRVQ